MFNMYAAQVVYHI